MANIVAIVGRPNVGKSTLFNRLVGERNAIMDDESGVTRDRHYGHAEWIGKFFTVIDTGGYVQGSDDIFEKQIQEQVELAMDEASVIIFVVDAHVGVHHLDEEFAGKLRKSKKPIFLVLNKADNFTHAQMAGEFYSLGVGDVYPISSQSGAGTGELLDEVVKHFPDAGIEDPDAGIPRIAILGRPNAGKSSFVNLLLGKNRSIVTEIAGTTRDAVDARYNTFGKEFILTDTAGLRKKPKVTEDIEFYSVMRSIKALENSDVCVVMIDAERGLEAQDMTIIGMAEEKRKGIVILVNKWDLIEKDTSTAKAFEDAIKEKIAPLTYIPIMFISVQNKQRIFQAVELIVRVYENMHKKIATSLLNEVMLAEIAKYAPPAIKGKYIKIKYVTQLPTNSISFAFFCNLPQYIKDPYKGYLENKIRHHFGFEGVPVNIICKAK
ncbi:MAG TPA: ribosome biogenesis GTPase Der [Cytophagaceae bacterium]|jgi:GTP-binding protein|nr:ribosome biogenesis GTPase Der [Cytophagaceae bacterium]